MNNPLELPKTQRREYDDQEEAQVCEQFLRYFRQGRKTSEKLKEYAGLVKEMRDTQKEYFKTRSKEVLMASKKLEGKLDQITKEILNNEGGIQF